MIEFVGPIQPPRKKMGAWYIIIVTEYLTRWEKVQLAKDYTRETIEKFII